MNLEDEIRSALRPKEPSPEFTERVLARVSPAASMPRPAGPTWVRWVAALAASILLAAGALEYRQYRGEQAKSQVLLAVRIAGGKLSKAQKRVQMLNTAHRNSS